MSSIETAPIRQKDTEPKRVEPEVREVPEEPQRKEEVPTRPAIAVA